MRLGIKISKEILYCTIYLLKWKDWDVKIGSRKLFPLVFQHSRSLYLISQSTHTHYDIAFLLQFIYELIKYIYLYTLYSACKIGKLIGFFLFFYENKYLPSRIKVEQRKHKFTECILFFLFAHQLLSPLKIIDHLQSMITSAHPNNKKI